MRVSSLILAILMIVTVVGGCITYSTSSYIITIRNDGVVVVEFNETLTTGINRFPVPVKPIPVSIEAYVNGTLIPVFYVNETICVPSTMENVGVYIRYVANVSSVDGRMYFFIETNDVVRLVIEPKVILLTIPKEIINMTMEDGILTMVFRGPARVEYITSVNITTTPTTITTPPAIAPITTPSPTTTTPTPTTSTTETSPTPTSPPPSPLPAAPIEVQHIYIIAAIIAIAVVAYAIAKVKGGKSYYSEYLDEVDRRILEEIRRCGGSIYQGDLQRRLDLPKTTLWRRVNKLARLGFIEVVKEGRVNKLILRK